MTQESSPWPAPQEGERLRALSRDLSSEMWDIWNSDTWAKVLVGKIFHE